MSASPADPNPPAILLAGGVIALSVARSLMPNGVPVYGLGHPDDALRHSRHRREFADVGMGAGVQERFFEWLERGPRQGVVLPCSDEGVELVARRRADIAELGYTNIEIDEAAALSMIDKQRTFELAREAGVEVPWTETVASVAEAKAATERTGYPVALKPRHSHLFAQRFGVASKAFIVDGGRELEAALATTAPLGLEMMVTEIVPGPDEGFCSYYTYLDEHGNPLLAVTKRKLRQFPPGFGAGCYHLTDWNPEVAELGLRFLQSAGVRGLANVEFKRDPRDGRLKLIECNHRFTAANEQLRRCGADMALFTYNRILGRPLPEIEGYRRGVGHWYPLRDARAFAEYRRRGELRLGHWLATLMRPQTFPLASLGDPMPSLVSAGRRIRRLAQRRSITSRSASSRSRPATSSADPASKSSPTVR